VYPKRTMAIVRQELAEYGRMIAKAGLTAGAGGNISARDGRLIWVKPSGLAMAELKGTDMCCIDADSGRQIEGKLKPTSELPMHLAIYRARPDVHAIFHTHSPWASGVISAGVDFKPMFAEVINDLGGIAQVPYIMTSTKGLGDAVAEAAKKSETIFMTNHGVVTLGRTMKQAYFRACVAEDAAKSFVAASIVGKPAFLTEQQIAELKKLEAGAYRTRMAEK
jgi:L-fuculose-phosphate aldolase